MLCSPRVARLFAMTAGLLMVQEADGVVTDMAGHSLDHLRVDLITSYNGPRPRASRHTLSRFDPAHGGCLI